MLFWCMLFHETVSLDARLQTGLTSNPNRPGQRRSHPPARPTRRGAVLGWAMWCPGSVCGPIGTDEAYRTNRILFQHVTHMTHTKWPDVLQEWSDPQNGPFDASFVPLRSFTRSDPPMAPMESWVAVGLVDACGWWNRVSTLWV